MKRLPDVQILGTKYRVYVKNEQECPDLCDCHAVTDPVACTIVFDHEIHTSPAFEDTKLHEALHAIFSVSGIEHDIKNHMADKSGYNALEERIVRILAPSLLTVLPQLKRIKCSPKS